MTDEEEVVRALWYLGKVGVTDPRSVDVETKDVSEDFWRYACDVQQRVSGALESDGVEVDLAVHPGDLNALCQISHGPWNVLTHIDSCVCFFFGRGAAYRSVEEGWRFGGFQVFGTDR